MRAKLTIVIFIVFVSCKNKIDYLTLAENEINNEIEETFQTDTENYWFEIERLFFDYSVEKGYLTDSIEKWQVFENYLQEVQTTGMIGMESEKHHERFLELRSKLLEFHFLVDTGTLRDKGINHKFLYNLYNPTIEKYKTELDSIVKLKPELIYGIGTVNPDTFNISLMITVGGILANYNKEDFIKPVVQKSILLDIFCHQILYSYKEPEIIFDYDNPDSVLILEDTDS